MLPVHLLEVYLSIFRHIPVDGTLVLEPRHLWWRLPPYLAHQTHPFTLLPGHVR